uniref:Alternative protein CELSR1 n=1 Tax=Homo sapiens TaxID=9606 RepID=L8ECE5_HUMAN|nr:alternative protein CELSR1 [Homo sapiens]
MCPWATPWCTFRRWTRTLERTPGCTIAWWTRPPPFWGAAALGLRILPPPLTSPSRSTTAPVGSQCVPSWTARRWSTTASGWRRWTTARPP